MKKSTMMFVLVWGILLWLSTPVYSQCICYEQGDVPYGNVVQCESFDDYSLGPITPKSSFWDLWETGSDDALVAFVPTTNSKGLKVERTSTSDPDVVYKFGSIQKSGRFRLSWSMYIAAGKEGYYNIQHNYKNWAYIVYFSSNGMGHLQIPDQPAGVYAADFPYVNGGWNNVMQIIDIDHDVAELWINDEFIYSWKFSRGTDTLNWLWGINFYANTNNLYYIDNICLRKASPTCDNPTPVSLGGVCVENGKYYDSATKARCDLYRSKEWKEGFCQGEFCSKAITVQCDQLLTNQTNVNAGNALNINSYKNCLNVGTPDYSGSEKVYKITVTKGSYFQIGLESLSGDQDLFLLDDNCEVVKCLDYSVTTTGSKKFEGIVHAQEGSSTYYIVVDSPTPAQNGSYNIDFTCGDLNCNAVQSLTCNNPYTSNTNLGANNISIYKISNIYEADVPGAKNYDVMNSGPERVHKFTLTSAQTVTITLSGLSSNLELFLLNTCYQNSCTALSINKGTNSEILVETLPAGTYYVVVDGYNDASGPYTLKVSCGDNACSCYETDPEMQGKVVLCDNFDAYTSGTGIVAQSSNKWQLRTGGADAVVVASPVGSGKVLKVERASTTPDVLYLLGNRTTGRYRLSWKMYLTNGKNAYYNLQHAQAAGNIAYEVLFNGNASGYLKLGNQASGKIAANFTYLNNSWNRVMQIIDLDRNIAELWINDNFIHAWPFSLGSTSTLKQLGAINFYANTNNLYYIDDICLREREVPICGGTLLEDLVCVKNGESYRNDGFALCELYRPAEWVKGGCNVLCGKASTISCGQFLTNQTNAGAGNSLIGVKYGTCAGIGIPYSAAEKVYKVVMNPGTGVLQIGLESLEAKDLDVFVFNEKCDPIQCRASSTSGSESVNNYEGIFEVEIGGTYYIVVDGKYPEDEGKFNIDVTCGYFSDADQTNAQVLQCGSSINSNTSTGVNKASVYGLKDGVASEVLGSRYDVMNSGPERIYKFTLNVSQPVTISLTELNADLELFLLRQLTWTTLEDQVLAKSTNRGTLSESITQTLAAGTYYVVVDGYNKAAGPYTISLSCSLDCSCYETDPGLKGKLVLCENFESYNIGAGIVAQASSKWSLSNVNAKDPLIAAKPAGTGKALKVEYLSAPAPDVLLPLGNRNSNRYRLSWQMYVSSGKTASYNIHHAQTPGNIAYRVEFNADGTGSLYVGGSTYSAGFNYTNGNWNRVMQIIDLDKDVAELWINDNFVFDWHFSIGSTGVQKQLGALNFYTNPSGLYYVDDLCLREKDPVSCSYPPLLGLICVKNGTSYDNIAQANCDLYGTNEWTVGDCTTFCNSTTTIQCGQFLSAQTTTGGKDKLNNLDYEKCLDVFYPYTAEDKVYKVNITQSSILQIGLENLDAVDLDLLLFQDTCINTPCINESISINPSINGHEGIVQFEAGGIFYIVVDSKSPGKSGRFNLDIACGYLTAADAAAAPVIPCGGHYSANTNTDDNDVSIYGLKPGVASEVLGKNYDVMNSGPDKVHKFTLTKAQTVSIILSNLSANLELFLLDTCNWNKVIAKSVNTGTTSESISKQLAAGTYYIVVDGYNGASGLYTLSVNCETDCACYAGETETGGDLVLCDNFEDYTTGKGIANQSIAKWQLRATGADDALVANNPTGVGKVLKVEQSAAIDPNVLFLLGNRTTGRYRLSWGMYITSGKTGYYNIQHAQSPGNQAYELNFNTNGKGLLKIGAGTATDTFSYKVGAWNRVMQIIDLDKNIAEFWINDQFVYSSAFSTGSAGTLRQLGAINFYASTGASFFIDEICLRQAKANCSVFPLENFVCVKNGETYLNDIAARCALYREAEWVKGKCCPDPIQEDPNCGIIGFRYSGDGKNLTYTFESSAIPVDGKWTIGDINISNPGAKSITYSFPKGAGVYKDCIVYPDAKGCYVYCCKNFNIKNPYEGTAIQYQYLPQEKGFLFSLPAGKYTNISWKILDGISLGFKETTPIVPVSAQCQKVTVVVQFYDPACACWNEERRCVSLCEPQDCGIINYRYISDGAQTGYQFSLNQPDAREKTINWWVEETGQQLGSGSKTSALLPVTTGCNVITIWSNFYSEMDQCWKSCWRRIFACYPGLINYEYQIATGTYAFTLDSAAAYPNIQWSIDALNLNLGTGQTVSWKTETCGDYVISARYFDPTCQCWRLRTQKINTCNPFNCANSIAYLYNNGALGLNVSSTFKNVKWFNGANNQLLGTGNTIAYNFPGGVIQVCVRYTDPLSNAERTCCRTITTGPPLANLTTSGTPAAVVKQTEVEVSAKALNNGNGTAVPSVLSIYLWSDSSRVSYEIGIVNLTSLGVGQSQSVTFKTDVSKLLQPVPAGKYQLGYCLDARNQVLESNEKDNCYAFPNLSVVVPAVALPYLDLSNTLVQIPAAAGKKSIAVSSNTAWGVSNVPSWLKISPASGFGNATVDLFYLDNPSTESRSTNILFKAGVLTKTLQLIQEKTLNTQPVIDIENNSCGAKGTRINVPVRARNFKNIVSAQMSFALADTTVGRIVGRKKANLTGVDTFNLLSNRLAWIWYASQAINLPDSAILLTLVVELKGEPGKNTTIEFSNVPTAFEINQLVGTDLVVVAADKYPGSICVQANSFSVGGKITREDQVSIAGVKVTLSGAVTRVTYTDNLGNYQFMGLPGNLNYVITPELNKNYRNGISGSDIFLIQRHILGLGSLNSPYKIIAADVNRSGAVSGGDLFVMQRLILAFDTLIANNKSWRFIPQNYAFVNSANPFIDAFPEVITVNNLASNITNAHFIGVKVGDVNLSNNPQGANLQPIKQSLDAMIIRTEEQNLQQGEIIEVSFKAGKTALMGGYQFTMGMREGWLELLEIIPGDLPGMGTEDYGVFDQSIGMLWTHGQGEGLYVPEGTELFRIKLRVNNLANGKNLSQALELNSAVTSIEAFGPDAQLKNVKLAFANGTLQKGLLAHQAVPNPTPGTSTLQVRYSGDPAPAEIILRDELGRQLNRIQTTLFSGLNQIQLNLAANGASGIITYEIKLANENAIGRIMLLQ